MVIHRIARWNTLVCVLAAFLLALGTTRNTGVARADAPPPYSPLTVYCRCYVTLLQKIDGVESTFFSDFYLQVFWNDPTIDNVTLAYDSATMFNPTLEMINVVGTPEQTIESPYQVHASAPTSFMGIGNLSTVGPWVQADFRYKGDFLVDMNLRAFPFDSQTVFIMVESALWPVDQVVFSILPANLPPKGILKSGFSVQGWTIAGDLASLSVVDYELFQSAYSRMTFSIKVDRDPQYYLSKFVLGVVVLVMMSILCFALEVDEADRMMGTLTVFLAIISYMFIASQDLPKVAYQTRIDSFMTLSFLTVFSCMFVHACNYLLFYYHEKQDEHAELDLQIAEAEEAQAEAEAAAASDDSKPSSRCSVNLADVDVVHHHKDTGKEDPTSPHDAIPKVYPPISSICADPQSRNSTNPLHGPAFTCYSKDEEYSARKPSAGVTALETLRKLKKSKAKKLKRTRSVDALSVVFIMLAYAIAAALVLTGEGQ
eukprot:ANDGO_08587.mRNA.1 Cys-loop ligand-gated ion channel